MIINTLHAAQLLVFLLLSLGFVLQAKPSNSQARVKRTVSGLDSLSLTKMGYEKDCQIAEKKPPKYRVWRVLRPASNGTRLAYVSLSPKHFDAEQLTMLAASLNTRFQTQSKLKAILFDDPVLARNYAYGYFDPTGMEDEARGLYYLDRTIPEEYIQFSTVKGNPINEIKITLQPKKPSGSPR